MRFYITLKDNILNETPGIEINSGAIFSFQAYGLEPAISKANRYFPEGWDEIYPEEEFWILKPEFERIYNAEDLGIDGRTDKEIVAETNQLAAELYSMKGCGVPKDFRFDKSQHPEELLVWEMARMVQIKYFKTDPKYSLEDEE